MSWLARSIANSLQIDDDEHHHDLDLDDDDTLPPSPSHDRRKTPPPENAAESLETESESDGGDLRGVKEDLAVFKESLTRQLWGVANFLAPPPAPPPLPELTRPKSNYLTELTRPKSNYLTELTRPKSNYRDAEYDYDDENESPSGYSRDNSEMRRCGRGFDRRNDGLKDYELRTVNEEEEEEEEEIEYDDLFRGVVGLTEEVLTFAGNVAHHPETWLDFPIQDDEDDFDDFPMSEAQKRHTQAVENLSPRLAALRIELCPAHMSIGFFWKVYFVLLHSRLNKQDADLLSTPEIVEARAEWMQELQKRAKKDSERYHGNHYGSVDFDEDFTPTSLQNGHSETHSSWTFASEPATSSTTADSDTEKHINTEIHYTEKSLFDEKPFSDTNYKHSYTPVVSRTPALQFDDDGDDDWPEDDCLVENGKVIPVGIDDDISFSDLEDDDCCIPVISKPGFQV